jgi:hypothetical protein
LSAAIIGGSNTVKSAIEREWEQPALDEYRRHEKATLERVLVEDRLPERDTAMRAVPTPEPKRRLRGKLSIRW